MNGRIEAALKERANAPQGLTLNRIDLDWRAAMQSTQGTCSIDDCMGAPCARGFCQKHYRRFMKHGDPLAFYPDATRACTFDGCDRPHEAQGLCHSHRAQAQRGAELTPLRRWVRGTAADRFEAYIVRGDSCWEWTGAISSTGYGHMSLGGRMVAAHRIAHELFKGPIPEGLVIDHICRNRRCANPDHLEAVTNEENLRRGREASDTSAPAVGPHTVSHTVSEACADLAHEACRSVHCECPCGHPPKEEPEMTQTPNHANGRSER